MTETRFLLLFGRSPVLSAAEVDHLIEVGLLAGCVETRFQDGLIFVGEAFPQKIFSRMGGTIRVVRLAATIEELLPKEGTGKFIFGFSYFHVSDWIVRRKNENISTKKALSKQNISSRFISSDEAEISSASVRGNGLLRRGAEFIVYANSGKEFFGRTEYLHDIDAYTARDRARPARDASIGMLPPKLAQIIVNLAVGKDSRVIWDPLVGTGVIPQEALLDGYSVVGSDILESMVAATDENLRWLRAQHSGMPEATVFRHDVRSEWPEKLDSVDTIASEGYLGPLLYCQPGESQIAALDADLANLYRNFFSVAAGHLRPGQRIVICFPCFQIGGKVRRMSAVDELASNTYTLQGIYDYAPHGQIVGRQITIFEKV
jgi:tRNA G10  N-methylase Trm11